MKKAIPLFISALLTLACGTEKKQNETSTNSRFELLPDPEGEAKDHEVEASEKENLGVAKYAGIYHFGYEEEGGFNLHLHFSRGIWSAQRRGGAASEDGSMWIPTFTNFRNTTVDIDGNFSTTEILEDDTSIIYKGKFIDTSDASGRHVGGLEILPAGSEGHAKDTAETSYKFFVMLRDMYHGEYPESSYRLLHKIDLKALSEYQLQIMRNTIYARYGLNFVQDSAMRKYFDYGEWYQPIFDNVDAFLNDFERENIKLINTLEAEK